MTAAIGAGAVATVILALLGLRQLALAARDRRRAVAAADTLGGPSPRTTWWASAETRFARTRPGRWLGRELDTAGMSQTPLVVALIGVGIGLLTMAIAWTLLAPLMGVAGLFAGYLAVRGYVRRAQDRRRDKIVNQLPELARVLANASQAGLSLPTAVAVAARELPEPSRSELARVADRLRFGAPIERALEEFRDRVKSREVGVLISTLVVSSRAGGSLVTALRGIATSLDQRKETRREIMTTLSQPKATAYMIVLMAFGILLLLNGAQPGSVEAMTRDPIGIAGLVVAFGMLATGFLIVNRMTRVEL